MTYIQLCLEKMMTHTSNTLFVAQDGLKILQRFVHYLNRPNVRSTTTLMGKVIGDRNAATMFLRLLYWFPKSRKSGGWVYKSWRDWEAECNLSQAQVKRVHRMGYLEQVGIERKTMKANGTPTTHYRLNEHQLLQALSTFTGLPIEQIRDYFTEEPMAEVESDCPMKTAETDQPKQLETSSGLVHESPIRSVKNTQSITSIPALESTNNYQIEPPQKAPIVVVEPNHQLSNRLQSIGISPLKAIHLITLYGCERVSEVCEQVEKQHLDNPAGYLVRALRENWQWMPVKREGQSFDGQAYITGTYADFIHS
jgi:hypothetical protein